MKELLKKFTGRKFIAMILGVLVGVAVVFGTEGEDISTVAGAVTSLGSLVYYMFTEGKIDREALGKDTEEQEEETEKTTYTEENVKQFLTALKGNGEEAGNGDINGDGTVSISDVTALLNLLSGKGTV
ncbi:MAG: hypothetical protein ACI3XN_04775 [Eubacteriales bacterium]|nr:hypothetical protein [Clostridiales bacterium]HCH67041.1 hypothetical protein [Clostridiales bacterium]